MDPSNTASQPAARPRPFSSPVQFLAFGFGSGLSPVGPGTAGTLVALPAYWYLVQLPLWGYTASVLLAAIVGVWICGAASRELGVHDHPGIVWDEFVGLWITLWALPVTPVWIVAGFVVFRILDIAKPWPIGALDRHVSGGFGIMVDDMVAGLVGCAALHVALWLTGAAGAVA